MHGRGYKGRRLAARYAKERQDLRGLSGNDTLVGGKGRDVLLSGLGYDRLDSRDDVGGNDVLYGGQGRDVLLKDPGDFSAQ